MGPPRSFCSLPLLFSCAILSAKERLRAPKHRNAAVRDGDWGPGDFHRQSRRFSPKMLIKMLEKWSSTDFYSRKMKGHSEKSTEI